MEQERDDRGAPATAVGAAVLDRFRPALSQALLACTRPGVEGRELACDVVDRLSRLDPARPAHAPRRASDPADFPVLRHWPAAIANGLAGPPWVVSLCAALDALRVHLRWHRHPEPGLPGFTAGHANANLIGPGGLVETRQLLIGMSLMAPDTVYPDHHHPPAEGYVVLSQGQWRQEQGPWKTPGAGGWIYNPPDIVHAMRSGPQPLLAVWCLPLN